MKFMTFQSMAAAAMAAAAVLGTATAAAQEIEKLPAFPGAEGFGRYTTGGRGGNVYHVTNLKDKGTGSLRWALSQPGPRTIVFDVSGTISLTESLQIPANTTLAGQTAPGDGICIADYPVSVGSNTIIRYMRFRLGNKNVTKNGADGWDGLSAMDSQDIIIDHCSVSWSIDECCSVLGNSNTTLQWSIVDQSLVNSGHSKGAHGYGGNWGGSGASFHHNLVAHHGSRTPRLGPRQTTQTDERMDMRNNVIYNFGGNGCYGGEGMTVNIVNNTYKPGPGSPTNYRGRRIAGVGIRTVEYCLDKNLTAANFNAATGSSIKASAITGSGDGKVNYLKINKVRYDIDPATNTIDVDGKKVTVGWNGWEPMLQVWGRYFVEGNVNTKYSEVTDDNWTKGMIEQIDRSASATDGTWSSTVEQEIKLAEPMPFIVTTTHSAEDAYERVLSYSGASLRRDSHDDLIIADARDGKATFTGSGLSKGFINTPEDLRPSDAPADWSPWPTLASAEAPKDTDHDGMPDEWELAHGLNPNDPADRNNFSDEGYTMLEVYLASLVEHITEAQNAGGTLEGDIESIGEISEFYELSMNTKESGGWTFGNGIGISNSKGGGYTSKGEYFGCGRDQQHTVTIPAGVEIKWVRFEGFGRYTSDSYAHASLVELNGREFPEGEKYLPKGTDPSTIEVGLEKPARFNVTMTWKGNNPYLKMFLYTTDNPSLGVESVIGDIPGEGEDTWYNLQGIRIAEPSAPGLYIHNGRKVIIR